MSLDVAQPGRRFVKVLPGRAASRGAAVPGRRRVEVGALGEQVVSDVELPGLGTRSRMRYRCPAEVAARLSELASPRLVALGGQVVWPIPGSCGLTRPSRAITPRCARTEARDLPEVRWSPVSPTMCHLFVARLPPTWPREARSSARPSRRSGASCCPARLGVRRRGAIGTRRQARRGGCRTGRVPTSPGAACRLPGRSPGREYCAQFRD
jgi:hypothetical protein